MCPGTWQTQYKLKADTVPECVHDLLDDLEKIEKAFPMQQEQPSKMCKANPGDSIKRKVLLFHKPIPKKPRKDAKHCSLCKKHGGVYVTHNTSDCHKYKKDGKIKGGFGKSQCGSTASDK